jgi:circadian clock protein KaiC
MEYLLNGAQRFEEPGLFVSFEESPSQLRASFLPLGFDIEALEADDKLAISHLKLSAGEVTEAGGFSLDGLFVQLEQGIARIGAKRVVLDTLESLFSNLSDSERLRAEMARLLDWLKARDVTVVVTGERGTAELTRHGFEEYVSDCVLLLDHRISNQISKRRLRIVKYRGSAHGKDEYPFLITDSGFSVLPITSVKLDYAVGERRVSTGIDDLDVMLGGAGYFEGSTVIATGPAGTGKSTLAAAFAAATCARGEPCLYLAFEESADQLVRNMRSVGIDLGPPIAAGLLHILAFRPTLYGIEEHLVTILGQAQQHRPRTVVMDPVTNFLSIGGTSEVKSMLTRVLDLFRGSGTTMLLTSLTSSGAPTATETEISSLMDTWIVVGRQRHGNAYHRRLHVLKSRGMDHSHAIRELDLSSDGISLRPLPDVGWRDEMEVAGHPAGSER